MEQAGAAPLTPLLPRHRLSPTSDPKGSRRQRGENCAGLLSDRPEGQPISRLGFRSGARDIHRNSCFRQRGGAASVWPRLNTRAASAPIFASVGRCSGGRCCGSCHEVFSAAHSIDRAHGYLAGVFHGAICLPLGLGCPVLSSSHPPQPAGVALDSVSLGWGLCGGCRCTDGKRFGSAGLIQSICHA